MVLKFNFNRNLRYFFILCHFIYSHSMCNLLNKYITFVNIKCSNIPKSVQYQPFFALYRQFHRILYNYMQKTVDIHPPKSVISVHFLSCFISKAVQG